MSYEGAKARAMPYDKIVGKLPDMRAQSVALVTEAVKGNVRTYVLVNNRAEEYAPLTIQALVDRLIMMNFTLPLVGDAV